MKEPYYAIGIDTYDDNALAYCLSRKVGDTIDILLCKTMRDKNDFNKEVDNLAKYFNADIIK